MRFYFLISIAVVLYSCSDDVVIGCTDETAVNYEPLATVEDESCRYDCLCECNGTIVWYPGTFDSWTQNTSQFYPYDNINADGIATAMSDCADRSGSNSFPNRNETWTCYWVGCD
jgi:hypothetical protein